MFYTCRNHKLNISRAPTKAKSREPAYSQTLSLNKIDRQRSKSRESGRQTDGYGGWCLELRRGGKHGERRRGRHREVVGLVNRSVLKDIRWMVLLEFASLWQLQVFSCLCKWRSPHSWGSYKKNSCFKLLKGKIKEWSSAVDDLDILSAI